MRESVEWKISFKDYIVLVTGGASGIGFGIAREFIQYGGTVVGVDNDEKTLQGAAKTLGEGFIPKVCDITVEKDIISAMEFVEDSFGKLDALINNAGRSRFVGVEGVKEEDYHYQYDVFVKGPMLTVKHFIPLLRKSPNPCIINVVSMQSLHCVEANMTGIYGSAKAALEKYTRYLARELPGIRSNVVHPGCVDTPIYEKAGITQEQKEAIFEGWKKRIPCGRVGKPEDIANCILFVCSEKASYINGASILVDGGWSTGADWGW